MDCCPAVVGSRVFERFVGHDRAADRGAGADRYVGVSGARVGGAGVGGAGVGGERRSRFCWRNECLGQRRR